MADSPLFIFKQFVLDERTLKPVYNFSRSEILCDVQMRGGEMVTVFINAELLMDSGIIDLSFIDELNSMLSKPPKIISPISSSRPKDNSKETVLPGKKAMKYLNYIWSTRIPTLEDNAATIRFLQIVNNEPYSKLSLNGSILRACDKLWQVIFIELKFAGFEVSSNMEEGGMICREMWMHLYSGFFGIEKVFRITGNSVNDNQGVAQQLPTDKKNEAHCSTVFNEGLRGNNNKHRSG